MSKIRKQTPAANIVIFGGNGDLAWRKLIPAFYNLYITGFLPKNFAIYGVHYQPMKEREFEKHLLEGVNTFSRSGKAKQKEWNEFAKSVHYYQGDFTKDETFEGLAKVLKENDEQWQTRAVRMFYYSVSPKFIEPISLLLAKYEMVSEVSLDRIVVEKPFGSDLATARELNQLLTAHFKEKQIFRIDHYLGKETVQNLLAFRFANIVFESLWNHNYIDHVQITVAENIGVGSRGNYYETAGALRDMIQNHLFQLLCVVAMEPPLMLDAEEVRNKKADVLKAVRRFTSGEIKRHVVRGQYGEGKTNGKKQPAYRDEKNVDPKSLTETFVALKLHIDNWRWVGVPFYLRTGKCLEKTTSLIVVQFKPVPHHLFGSRVQTDNRPNQLIISIQPEMETTLLFHAKEPGVQMHIKPVEMDFTYKESYDTPVPEAYETLLLDILEGDAALFMRADQVEEAWKVVTPIMEAWNKDTSIDFPNYEPGSWGPDAAVHLIDPEGCGWTLLPEESTIQKKLKQP